MSESSDINDIHLHDYSVGESYKVRPVDKDAENGSSESFEEQLEEKKKRKKKNDLKLEQANHNDLANIHDDVILSDKAQQSTTNIRTESDKSDDEQKKPPYNSKDDQSSHINLVV